MESTKNIQNNPHQNFYEIPDEDSTTKKVLLIIGAFLLAGALSVVIIALSSNLLGKLSVGDRLPIGIVALPYAGGGLSFVFLRILYSLSPTVRETFELPLHISEEEVEKIKNKATLAEVTNLLIKYPTQYTERRNVNLGKHVRNGKLTPENVKFLDRMVEAYHRLSEQRYSTVYWFDYNSRIAKLGELDKEIQALETEWQKKERSNWK